MAKGARAAPTVGVGRLVGMNGLRGVAALTVVITHVRAYGTPNGGAPVDAGLLDPLFVLLSFGVPLFFSVSGFLLYRRFAAAIIIPRRRPSVIEYARARVLRIVPPYWAILFVTGVLFPAALIHTTSSGVLALGSLAHHPHTLLADFALVQNYSPRTTITGIGPTWTLLNETIFYLVLPLLALPLIAFAARFAVERKRVIVALAAPAVLLAVGVASKTYGAAALGLRWDGGWSADWQTVFQRSFVYQADLFAAGMTAAVLSLLVERGTLRVSQWHRLALLSLAAVIFGSVPFLARHGMFPLTFVDTAVTVACGLLLLGLATVGDRRSLLGRALQWRPIASVGLASYSLFLWHEPIVRWMSTHGFTWSGRVGLAGNILVVATISLALSAASYRLVERPSLAFRKRLDAGRGAPAAAPAAVMDAG